MLDISLLLELLSIDSPSGDEYRMADWLENWLAEHAPDCAVKRLRDCLIVTRGKQPKTAIFAHIDTVGHTVSFGKSIYPIGHPATPREGALVRVIGRPSMTPGKLHKAKPDQWHLVDLDCSPGDRIVTADPAVVDTAAGTITSPYLDNRGGIYAALQALLHAENVAIAFTTGEETGASGAKLCAQYLWNTYKVANALVSDITWHTKHVHCGNGVAISRRDASIPSQRYVDMILQHAEQSGIRYQIEIESTGGSDGMGIENSACPIDWIFVGAPEKRPHTPTEQLHLSDLDSMANMLAYLAGEID